MGGIVDEQKLDQEMNALGEEGWELVAAFDTQQGAGQTRDVLVIFKRLKN